MSELRDDDVRAMLEARADRLPARVAAGVMAAVHEEVRAPRGGAAFAVLPVMPGRSSMPGTGWAAAALVAVLVLAVLGGLPRSGPAATVSPSEPSPGSSSAASPGASTPGGGFRAIVSLVQLRRALADGSLDGRLVLVNSTLRRGVAPACPAGGCAPTFGLDLVGPVVTDSRSTQPAVPAQPGSSALVSGVDWVVVPHAGTLVLIGRMADPADQPQTWSVLMPRLQRLLDPEAWLEPVAGWLVHRPGGTNVITESQPQPDGTLVGGRQAEFTLADPALGIDPSAAVTEGPFLVRLRSGEQPEIVARYDLSSLIAVVMPPITCAEPPPNATLQCQDAVAAAWAVDQGSSPISSVEFTYGSDGANGSVLLHHELAGQDLRVTVRAGPDGGVVIVGRGTYPLVGPRASPIPTPAFAPGASLVTPAGLRSGLADGTLDRDVVLIEGQLTVVPMFCTFGSDCFGIAVAGFEDVPTSHDGQLTRAVAAAMHGELAFVVQGQTLAFVGRVVGDVGSPVSLLSRMASGPAGAPDPFALTPVAGWLVVGGVHSCPALGVGATPCPGPPPGLTDLQPTAEGAMNSDLFVPVAIGTSVPGVQPGAVVNPGPFLVRVEHESTCHGVTTVNLTACLSVQRPTLRVLAHIDAVNTVRVVMAP